MIRKYNIQNKHSKKVHLCTGITLIFLGLLEFDNKLNLWAKFELYKLCESIGKDQISFSECKVFKKLNLFSFSFFMR